MGVQMQGQCTAARKGVSTWGSRNTQHCAHHGYQLLLSLSVQHVLLLPQNFGDQAFEQNNPSDACLEMLAQGLHSILIPLLAVAHRQAVVTHE